MIMLLKRLIGSGSGGAVGLFVYTLPCMIIHKAQANVTREHTHNGDVLAGTATTRAIQPIGDLKVVECWSFLVKYENEPGHSMAE